MLAGHSWRVPILATDERAMSSAAIRPPSVLLLVAGVWGLIAAQLLVLYWSGTAATLGDTDDAMRLVEVRAFLAGQGWFDLHEPRLFPPLGYDTHWSRLIDGGLALLFRLFALFTAPATAERLMRVTWPLLWLAPALAGLFALARRLAGPAGLLAVSLVAVLGLPAYQQFVPGRIDHHNVQITLAVLVLAATAWSDRRRWAAAWAGALSALALAVGFESLPFVILCGAFFPLRYVMCPQQIVPPAGAIASSVAGGPRVCGDKPDRSPARCLSLYGLALALGTVAAFLIGVSPSRWTATACDALAVNTAVPVVIAGLAFAILGRTASLPRRAARLTAVAVVGLAAAAGALALEPRCLAGPFGLMDPSAWPVWLSLVRENQPLAALAGSEPAVAATVAAFPLLALAAAAVLLRDPQTRRDPGVLIVTGVLAAAIVLMLTSAKLFGYAMWFGMPVVAALVVRAWPSPRLASPALGALAAVLLTPAIIGAAAAALTAAVATPSAGSATTNPACFASPDYRLLASLPPGLVVTEADYGPFVLALTPHSVLAAPYHRIAPAIVLADRILRLPPDQARALLAHAGATYVAVCTRTGPSGLPGPDDPSLRAQLRAGRAQDWLQPVETNDEGPFRIYRMVPNVPAPTR